MLLIVKVSYDFGDLTLNRVLAGPKALPGFWIFMYYVSPFTYLVDGMLSTGLANNNVECSDIELRRLEPANNLTCGDYMKNHTDRKGGYVTNPDATENCLLCPQSRTNTFLTLLNSDYSHRWRNFAIMWGFIGFNVCAALFLYWLARVPKKQKVLDSPPTELASRVPTKVSKQEANGEGGVSREMEIKGAAKEIQREKDGVGGMNGVEQNEQLR